MLQPNQTTHAEAEDATWKSLYRIGGAAALIMVAITLAQFVIFVVAPPPLEGTAVDWFALFQKNAFLGLLGFEVLLIVYVGLSVLVSLALFVTLRRANQSLTAIFLLLSLMGSIAFISARPALEMLSLSNQYAAATTDAQRATFLAAGNAMLAIFRGTAFQVSYLLGSITGLIIGVVMLGSGILGKAIPYLRIASSVLDFGIFIPTVGLFISLFSVVFLLLFNILIGRRLLQLGRGESKALPQPSPA
jgi:hypothetical protein